MLHVLATGIVLPNRYASCIEEGEVIGLLFRTGVLEERIPVRQALSLQKEAD